MAMAQTFLPTLGTKKYIYPALFCRLAGCIFLALVLNFYYGLGDTFSYFTGANEIWKAFVKSPAIAWEIISNHPKNYSPAGVDAADPAAVGPSEPWVVKFAGSHRDDLLPFLEILTADIAP